MWSWSRRKGGESDRRLTVEDEGGRPHGGGELYRRNIVAQHQVDRAVLCRHVRLVEWQVLQRAIPHQRRRDGQDTHFKSSRPARIAARVRDAMKQYAVVKSCISLKWSEKKLIYWNIQLNWTQKTKTRCLKSKLPVSSLKVSHLMLNH